MLNVLTRYGKVKMYNLESHMCQYWGKDVHCTNGKILEWRGGRRLKI